MSTDEEIGFPQGTSDERELLLRWLGFLRGALLRNVEGLSEEQGRWTPDGALISMLGIVNHLTHVEWRWIDGGMLGQEAAVRTMPSLTQPCMAEEGADLRWVLLHLINETARHAGHADATRELLDGATGE